MISKLKNLIGGEKTFNYNCTNCETSFSLSEDAPIECPDCNSSEFALPERNILVVDYQCTDCHDSFRYTEDTDLVCPSCDSTNLATI